MTLSGARIGIDFDNTLIRYDQVFLDVGRARGLLPKSFQGGKPEIRAHIQAQLGGMTAWTSLQAAVYGPGVAQAEPAQGALAFLEACRRVGASTAIVSHKTRCAAADPDGFDLRAAAWAWIERHGLIDPARGGVPADQVFFEDTRAAKIERIKALGCTHFIDDLEEVFREPSFPDHVSRHLILFDAPVLPAGPFRARRSWAEIADDLFAYA